MGERYFGGSGNGTWEQIDVEGSEKSRGNFPKFPAGITPLILEMPLVTACVRARACKSISIYSYN